MRSVLIIPILFLVTGIPSWAQQHEELGQSDPRAKAILDKVSEKYTAYQTIKTDFVLKIESPADDISEEQTGTVFLQGDKYKLNLADQEIICDNITIWTYLKDVNEVQINTYEPDEGTITPTQLFNIWEDGFLYALTGESMVNGKNAHQVDLTPFDKEKSYFKIRMMINKQDHSILQTMIFDKNGNRYTYIMKTFTPNVQLEENFFQFNPDAYKDIEVVDLR